MGNGQIGNRRGGVGSEALDGLGAAGAWAFAAVAGGAGVDVGGAFAGAWGAALGGEEAQCAFVDPAFSLRVGDGCVGVLDGAEEFDGGAVLGGVFVDGHK